MQGKPCNRPDQCSRSAQQNTDRVLRQRPYPPGRRCAGHYEGQSRSAPPVRRLPRGHPPQARFHCVQSQPKGWCPTRLDRAGAALMQAAGVLTRGGLPPPQHKQRQGYHTEAAVGASAPSSPCPAGCVQRKLCRTQLSRMQVLSVSGRCRLGSAPHSACIGLRYWGPSGAQLR